MRGTSFYHEMIRYELERLLGEERVITDEAEIEAQSLDVWWVTRFWKFTEFEFPKPYAIVFPETTEEVAAIIKLCNDHKIPIIPRGGGAGDSGGTSALTGGIVVDTKRMDTIISINEKSLTVTVQPGILQKHLEERLNRRGYTMNHFPASFTTSTLGGFISTNGTGVLSSKYGKLSDMTHRLEVVLPTGRVFKSLPVRLHSTGPDYSRLFFGAEGTLGIVTEAVCKIYHLPQKRIFWGFLLPNLKDGIEAGRKIMVNGLDPCLMRLYDEIDTRHIMKKQFGVEEDGCVMLIGFDGMTSIVDAQMAESTDILLKAGARDLGEAPGKNWWEGRYKSYYPPNDYIAYPWMTAVTDTVAPYEDIEKIYDEMKKTIETDFAEWNAEFHAHFSHWYDWGTSFYPTFVIKEFPDDPREAMRLYNKIMDAAVKTSVDNNGVVNEHHGIGLRCGRMMHDIYGDGYEVARSIKQALDPNNIMNPGKLGLGE